MASEPPNSNNPRNSNPATPQSIPLQDLSRPPDSEDIVGISAIAPGGHGNTGGGRTLLRGRESLSGRGAFGRYERVSTGSPTATHRMPGGPSGLPQIVTNSPYEDDDVHHLSPGTRGGFQDAMGFAGLSFQGESAGQGLSPISPWPSETPTPGMGGPSSGREEYEYFSPVETDTTPLTDPTHLQPISGTSYQTPTRRRADTHNTVRFASQSPSSRLGDDLPRAEEGRLGRDGTLRTSGSLSRDRSRSLSPGNSPLHRAGSIVRQMSQRVVNISNEPEVVEQSMRRKSSVRHPREIPFMDAPPELPAMAEFAHDMPIEPQPEKMSRVSIGRRKSSKGWTPPVNPLKGRTLGIFTPDNALRQMLCNILISPITEPFILFLILIQTILLAVDSSKSVYSDERSKNWGTTWIDYALLAIFSIYTLELIARIIVSGFILNAEEYSSIDRKQKGFASAIIDKGKNIISPQRQPSKKVGVDGIEPQPSILRSLTGLQGYGDDTGGSDHKQRFRLARRAFLRHSFNRLDFIAVVSFWISFILGLTGLESEKHIYVFRMLSCLRILRLLGITSGTSVILRSLKKAAPLLVNVAFLIGFFWLLFAIVGVQSFKSSFRRNCVWVDPSPDPILGAQPNFTNTQSFTLCGGYLEKTNGTPMPWVDLNGVPGAASHKGYLCPQNSFCVQSENPYNGTVSFDNILQSLELIFVIMSSNTFSDLLYYTTNTDYLVAATFFAAGIVILSFWLMNLLVAVITSSFQVIREEGKQSAFAAEETDLPATEEDATTRVPALMKLYQKTEFFWVLVIIYGLCVQALRSADMGRDRQIFIGMDLTPI
jgi:voltage-dependent calcium channel